ncbi:MAG: methionine synthase [Nocardioidaceae bacterium]
MTLTGIGSATGIGSMPGEDFASTMRLVTDELPELVHLPELPARGAHASMVGRSAALLEGLGADLQPAGWRLTDAPGLDQRRAVSLLAQDLDMLEETLQGYDGRLKVQVAGPWTLAATIERPRGDRVLADHGARRDLAQSLAAGIGAHVADVRRRVGGAGLLVQVDEPALPAVLAGRIPTASGFGRHRTIDVSEADRALRWTVEAVRAAGAAPVVHSCAGDVPVGLLAGAGFDALAFDPGEVDRGAYDDFSAAFDGGLDLWPGVVPTTEPAGEPSDRDLVRRVRGFLGALGFDPDGTGGRVVVTPSCGLSGASPAWARRALTLARTTARALAAP